ncbi:MAG TPA: hypothetical protein VGS11_05060 [Candidatus Bathyarchaeia archaeon]|nr:hypothetical protein [Candidatus Bathyarchaeia archaeon]
MSHKLRTEILLVSQTVIISLLLYWTFLETQSNSFLKSWLSQNFPLGLVLLNPWVIAAAITELALVTGFWIIRLESEGRTPRTRTRQRVELEHEPRYMARLATEQELVPPSSKPFYETINTPIFILTLALVTQAVSLWFVTASTFRITSFTANSFFYYSNLPFTYWWGLAATLALIFTRSIFRGRGQIALDISALFLLSFYLIGLPSFAYEDPRFLDAYYHTGNSLNLLNYQAWLNSPSWYGHQFPGVFLFVGQLTSIAGIDPFQLMRFYPLGLSLVIVFMVYVITRMFSSQYASIASATFLGGMWFQFHLSPQSLELILYLGLIFIVLKIIEDAPRRKLWTMTGLASIPIFVGSHPETPLAVTLGLTGFLILSLLKSKKTFLQQTARSLLPLGVLICWVLFWWFVVAVDALNLVQTTILAKALLTLSQLPIGIKTQASLPLTPSYSYGITVLMEQLVSVIVWAAGLSYFLFLRKLQPRELFLGGLFLAGVSTIPIAVFGRTDVLQRSYLFALVPFVILTAWLLERRSVLTFRGRDLFRLFRTGFIVMMVLFAVLIPITRYGIDPFHYIPGSSLYAANVAAGLQQHSILFLEPDEDGWRFYAGLQGAVSQPKLEQNSIAGQPGGFVKPNSDATLPGFNLTYSKADSTASYIVLPSYWQNLYSLRFGHNATYYYVVRNDFANNVTQNFNLVYSTGTDEIFANPSLG